VVLYGVVPAMLLGATCGYYRLVDYVEHDPGFCRNCHQSQNEYTLWTQSEHRNIVCQECHHQSRSESLALMRKFVFEGKSGDSGRRETKLHDPQVSGGACAKCHLRHDVDWPEIGGSVGHKVHLDAGGVGCMDCHARSIHKFGAASDACEECHHERTLRTTGMEKVHCLACHNFLTLDKSIKPSRAVCNDCHAANKVLHPVFPEDAPMATFMCWDCHRPHKAEGAGDVSCTSCHDEMAKAGLHANDAHQECRDCHEAHTWNPSEEQCTSCHADLDDHEKGEACWSCHSFDLVEGKPPDAAEGAGEEDAP